jgi:hypothetical protein
MPQKQRKCCARALTKLGFAAFSQALLKGVRAKSDYF